MDNEFVKYPYCITFLFRQISRIDPNIDILTIKDCIIAYYRWQ